MKKNPEAGTLSLAIDRHEAHVFGITRRTDSPEFMHTGRRMVSHVTLSLDVYDPWEKNEFILKNMETGEKIYSGKTINLHLNTKKPLRVKNQRIGMSYPKSGVSIPVLPSGVPLQGRMKLSNGIFNRAELPEDDARVVLQPDEYLGELPKASIKVWCEPHSAISAKLRWEVQIDAPEEEELTTARVDVFKVADGKVSRELDGDHDKLYSQNLKKLPKVGEKPLIVSNNPEEEKGWIAGQTILVFLTVRNNAGTTCCWAGKTILDQRGTKPSK